MKQKHDAIKALGEKDVLIGIALIVLGVILAAVPDTDNITGFVALALTILGVILAGFGINDYLKN